MRSQLNEVEIDLSMTPIEAFNRAGLMQKWCKEFIEQSNMLDEFTRLPDFTIQFAEFNYSIPDTVDVEKLSIPQKLLINSLYGSKARKSILKVSFFDSTEMAVAFKLTFG